MKARIMFLDNTEIIVDYYKSQYNDKILWLMTIPEGVWHGNLLGAGEIGIPWANIRFVLGVPDSDPVRFVKRKKQPRAERIDTVVGEVIGEVEECPK